MPTVEMYGMRIWACIYHRSRKGIDHNDNNPRMIPSDWHEGEKENLLELQATKRSDVDNAIFEERYNYLRSKNSNRIPKKEKMNVDVNKSSVEKANKKRKFVLIKLQKLDLI